MRSHRGGRLVGGFLAPGRGDGVGAGVGDGLAEMFVEVAEVADEEGAFGEGAAGELEFLVHVTVGEFLGGGTQGREGILEGGDDFGLGFRCGGCSGGGFAEDFENGAVAVGDVNVDFADAADAGFGAPGVFGFGYGFGEADDFGLEVVELLEIFGDEALRGLGGGGVGGEKQEGEGQQSRDGEEFSHVSASGERCRDFVGFGLASIENALRGSVPCGGTRLFEVDRKLLIELLMSRIIKVPEQATCVLRYGNRRKRQRPEARETLQ